MADADSGVKDLAVDLRDIKTIMAGVLTQEKQRYSRGYCFLPPSACSCLIIVVVFRYLFDGLGHLVASIFIKSTQYLKRININGVKKMCVLLFPFNGSCLILSLLFVGCPGVATFSTCRVASQRSRPCERGTWTPHSSILLCFMSTKRYGCANWSVFEC